MSGNKINRLITTINKLSVEEREDVRNGIIKEDNCSGFAERDLNSKKLKEEFRRLDSVWSSESRIKTWATIKLLEELEKLNQKKEVGK